MGFSDNCPEAIGMIVPMQASARIVEQECREQRDGSGRPSRVFPGSSMGFSAPAESDDQHHGRDGGQHPEDDHDGGLGGGVGTSGKSGPEGSSGSTGVLTGSASTMYTEKWVVENVTSPSL